jgi:hypothetical protein
MSRVMGLTCEAGQINVAAVEDGRVIDGVVERIPAPAGLEEHDRLWAVYDEVVRAINGIKPEKIVILCSESQYTASHKALTPRIALETVVRLASSKENVPVELLARPTVRSRLGLPKKGGLDTHLSQAIPTPVGRYWAAGRGLAAMAALAGERG